MRDMSHRAAAALTLGLINDDIYGALMNAPLGTTPGTAAVDRNRFADYLAASRWLHESDLEVSRDRTRRAATSYR